MQGGNKEKARDGKRKERGQEPMQNAEENFKKEKYTQYPQINMKKKQKQEQ